MDFSIQFFSSFNLSKIGTHHTLKRLHTSRDSLLRYLPVGKTKIFRKYSSRR